MMVVNARKYVTVYELIRAFGGQEEGGWYFDRLEGIESIEIVGSQTEVHEQAAKVLAELEAQYAEESDNNIASVAGGRAFRVYVEEKKHENEHLHQFYE